MNKKAFLGGVTIGILLSVFAVTAFGFTAKAVDGINNNMGVNEKISYISTMLNKYYVEDFDKSVLEDGMYHGLVESIGDPYTTYFTKAEMESFMQSTSGQFYGIGITVQYDDKIDKIVVIEPMEGLPAEKSGIKAGDYITKVNGQIVEGMDFDAALSLIRGEAGTTVDVTIWRESENKEYTMTVERTEVNVDSVSSTVIEDNIGYIYINGFKENTYEQFMENYNGLMDKKIKGLIIDVRDNPGGILEVVEKISDVLIPEGDVVYTIDKQGERKDYVSDASCIEIPLVVLVNGNSASASEILAGAVQDSGTGVLVGTQTFGKGVVQNLYNLPDGSGLKITVQKYYTPNGVCIQGTGITPDYVVELEETDEEATDKEAEDTQYNKAIEVVKEKINN